MYKRQAAEQTKAIPEYPAAVKKPSQGEKTTKTTPADNTLQRMVDRDAKRAEGKGVGYDRWAAKYNLKQMAATVTAYQQYGFSSPEELDEGACHWWKSLSISGLSARLDAHWPICT